MSGLTVRDFAKVEPSNREYASEIQQDITQKQPKLSGNDSYDSDECFQDLAPEQTLAAPSTLSFPSSQSLLLPKVGQETPSSLFRNDRISEDQGIIVKSERRKDASTTGPPVLNITRPVHHSDIPGIEKDSTEEIQLADLGLPTQFFQGMEVGGTGGGVRNYTEQKIVRKGQKETYYCELCMIDLSSKDTYESHIRGVKHLKKNFAMEAKNDQLRNQGLAPETKVVRQVPNPLPLQKKIPIRLHEKLRESRETIVGLDFIHEIIACSNAEVEPYYECMSCGNKGEANAMYNHLFSKNHRKRFLEKKLHDDSR